jgi:hypothetical protein
MRRHTVKFVVRSGLTIAAMLGLYAVIPVPGSRVSLGVLVAGALLGLAGLGYAFLSLAERARSDKEEHAIRVEALVAVLYGFVVFTSLVYLAIAKDGGEFAGLNTRIDALYFTMSTIATVGFGDVHATGQVARTVVTIQMFLDLIFVALVARIILPSLMERRARERAWTEPDSAEEPEEDDQRDVPTA